jgi:hypothetical protein
MERNSADRFSLYRALILAVLAAVLAMGAAVFLPPYFDEDSSIQTTFTVVVVLWVSNLQPIRPPKGSAIRGEVAESEPPATWTRSFPLAMLVLAIVVTFVAQYWLEAQGVNPWLVGTLAFLPAFVLLHAPRPRSSGEPTARATS